jgi:hypothetical protein
MSDLQQFLMIDDATLAEESPASLPPRTQVSLHAKKDSFTPSLIPMTLMNSSMKPPTQNGRSLELSMGTLSQTPPEVLGRHHLNAEVAVVPGDVLPAEVKAFCSPEQLLKAENKRESCSPLTQHARPCKVHELPYVDWGKWFLRLRCLSV